MPYDYSKSVIYRLTCEDPTLQYYGCTIQPLHKVLPYLHKQFILFSKKEEEYEKTQNDNTYNPVITLKEHKTSFNCYYKLFKVGSVEIEPVLEVYDCESQYELNEILDTYIDNDFCVNDKVKRTNPKKLASSKKYYETHKKTILNKQKISKEKREKMFYESTKHSEWAFYFFSEYLFTEEGEWEHLYSFRKW